MSDMNTQADNIETIVGERNGGNTREINQEKAEVFAGRMVGLLNEAAIALMAGIDHRTGL